MRPPCCNPLTTTPAPQQGWAKFDESGSCLGQAPSKSIWPRLGPNLGQTGPRPDPHLPQSWPKLVEWPAQLQHGSLRVAAWRSGHRASPKARGPVQPGQPSPAQPASQHAGLTTSPASQPTATQPASQPASHPVTQPHPLPSSLQARQPMSPTNHCPQGSRNQVIDLWKIGG